jgi:hypothetical protein
MTRNMIFVFRVGFFFFFFFMDDLALNDLTLILSTDINVDVSIETHMKHGRLLILRIKVREESI